MNPQPNPISSACLLKMTTVAVLITTGCHYGQNQSPLSSNTFSPLVGQTRVPPPATGSYSSAPNSNVLVQPASTNAASKTPKMNSNKQLPPPGSFEGRGTTPSANSSDVWPESFGPRSQSNNASFTEFPVAKHGNQTIQNPVTRVSSGNLKLAPQADDQTAINGRLGQGMPVTDLTQVSYGNTPNLNAIQSDLTAGNRVTPIASRWNGSLTENANFVDTGQSSVPQVETANVSHGLGSETASPVLAGERKGNPSQGVTPLTWRNPNAN